MQLDDLGEASVNRVRECAFLILATNPGNHQAWVAVTGNNPEFARLLRKEVGADSSASVATRLAGTVNFKRKYEPDFPTVCLAAAAPGRIVTATDLERHGLVAKVEQGRGTPPPVRPSPRRSGRRAWPSYARCLAGAQPNHGGTAPDVSRADFAWCMIAIDWGWSIEDTAARLMEESSKARENGERYAVLTAGNAAAAVQRRRGMVTV